MNSEETVWTGRSSHISNLPTYIVCGLTCWLVVPLFYGIWKWMELNCQRFELTTQRLRFVHGVFNREEDELELYRVKDIAMNQPFMMRLFGLGNVILHTSDKSTPELWISGVPDAASLRNQLRDQVERRRDEKRVREIDFE